VLPYLVVSGLTTGSLYALVAMGLVVVYKATTVVNFAHGELFMIGGFLAYTFHVLLKLGYLVSLVLAVAAALALGLVTERLAYRPLMRAPAISVVLAAVGFSFVLKGAARQIWGGLGDYMPFPPVVATPAITMGSLILVPQQLVVLAGALVCMGLFTAFFTSTRTGGPGGEIAALIAERAFEYLDAPIVRVAPPDTPVPYSPPLEEFFLPNAEKVGRAVRALYDY